jgi:hypothetical protein
MTNRIPVGATIARAYGFAFARFLPILGVVWFPIVIIQAITYFAARPYLTGLYGFSKTHDMHALLTALPLMFALIAVTLICRSMEFVGITELALGLRKGSYFFYFSLGATVWRLIGTYVLLLCVFIGFYVLFAVGAIVVAIVIGLATHGAATPHGVGLMAGLIAVVAAVAACCALVYVFMRLSFLITPVVVAEKRIGLFRSWHLTRGNFWRMFVISLAIVGPIIVVALLYFYYVWSQGFPSFPMGGDPEQMKAWSEAMRAWNLQMTDRMYAHWYISMPAAMALSVIVYGISVGASAFAYRALVPGDAENPAA